MSNYLTSNYNAGMDHRALLDETLASWTRERPDLDFAVMGTFLRLAQIMRLATRGIDDVFAPHGIALGEFDVLAALRRNGAGTTMTPSQLARVAMVSPGGMTNRLDRLERAGLISRAPDPADRRGSLVTLTAAGHEVADRTVEDLVAAEDALAADLSRAELDRFDKTLDKLLVKLDRLR